MSPTAEQQLRSRNLRTVLALAALFMVPLVVSFWLYYGTTWRPAAAMASHGELIEPPRPLTVPDAAHGSQAADPNLFKGRWSLVYVGNGRCDPACRRALRSMRQARLALNQDMTRVQRVFLVTEECCNREFLAREHAGLIVVDAGGRQERALVAQFAEGDREHMLYVVDPLGNLMMRYDARGNPTGLLEDLTRLLKLSHIG